MKFFHLLQTYFGVFLDKDLSDFAENGAKWVLQQAKWVIIAALVIMAGKAWYEQRPMQVIGSILTGIIVLMFAFADDNFLNSLQKMAQTILFNDR